METRDEELRVLEPKRNKAICTFKSPLEERLTFKQDLEQLTTKVHKIRKL